jgi:hypothetical protein
MNRRTLVQGGVGKHSRAARTAANLTADDPLCEKHLGSGINPRRDRGQPPASGLPYYDLVSGVTTTK